ncbi:MAG: glutathione S-transferase family protein [Pseudomonadota bacterium]
MLDFYHLPSSCSTAVKATLALTNAPHSLIPIDLANKPDAFLKANPRGKVPTVSVDGTPLFEGGAINLWLALQHPDAGLMPALHTLEGGEALKWLFFAYSSVHPVWLRLLFPDQPAGDTAKEEVFKRALESMFELYDMIDAQLQKHAFIAGETLTIADLYLAASIHWDGVIGGHVGAKYPSALGHRDRVLARPDVRAAFTGEFGYS